MMRPRGECGHIAAQGHHRQGQAQAVEEAQHRRHVAEARGRSPSAHPRPHMALSQ